MKKVILVMLVSLNLFAVEYPESDMRAYKTYQNKGVQILNELNKVRYDKEKKQKEVSDIDKKMNDLQRDILNIPSNYSQKERKRRSLYNKKDALRRKQRIEEDKLEKIINDERKLNEDLRKTKEKFDFYRDKIKKYYDQLKKEKQRNHTQSN